MNPVKQLDPLDFDVLDHVARYKMGVPESVARLPSLEGWTPGRVKNTLKRLRGEGYLKTAPLYGDRTYDHLTREGAEALDLPLEGRDAERLGQPLAEVPKVRAYAVLAFCCLSTRARQRLTPDEFKQFFAEHDRPGLPLSYYADHEAKKLGFVRVDTGGRGRWDRVVERVRTDVERHQESDAFRESIGSEGLEVTLVTATEQKAGRLRAAFAEGEAFAAVTILVHVVPELVDLIAPPRR